jgi:YHS domain-containing protein
VDGLLSFLMVAGLFYLMMRFGCGAHRVYGGHITKSIDPVCGMEVPRDKEYSLMYQGAEFRFRSRSCLLKFDDRSDRYLGREAKLT